MPAAPAAYRVRARNLAVESENKIHDDSVAATFGFAGGLVPGVELFAYASHPFTEAWGLDFVGGGRLSVRFRRPVYDGEDVTVTAAPAEDGSCTVAVEGADGEQRAVGRAWAGSDAIPLRHVYAEHPLPDQLLPIEGALPLGPLGSVRQDVDAAAHEAYLEGIGEALPVFRDAAVVHPGALLRMVNNVLMQNVALGPWIHTASDCRFLGVAHLPCTLTCHGFVVECYERNGNAYVRYDALVAADGTPVAEVDHTAIYRLKG